MNNRFKFRIWNKDRWINKLAINISGQIVEAYLDYGMEHYGGPYLKIAKNQNNFIVQQFTGLKDSKGNDIYEGDIISIYDIYSNKHENAEIIWSDEDLTWLAKVWYGKECWSARIHLLKYNDKEIKIIGNIFKNFEYLNKTND